MERELKQHLKTVTYPLHEWLESSKLFENIKSKNLTKEEYIELLKKLSSFIYSLEKKIEIYKEDFKKQNLQDIEQRLQKTKWLQKDLEELNIKTKNKELKFSSLNSFSSVIGALYVVEGSTMGGMQIINMIRKNSEEDLPLNYYQAYKEETMPMWMTFAKWLDEVQADKYEVTLGAMQAFISLKKQIDLD